MIKKAIEAVRNGQTFLQKKNTSSGAQKRKLDVSQYGMMKLRKR